MPDADVAVATPYYSAIVDQNDPNVGLGNVYATILAARDAAANYEDIFVRNAGDTLTFVIAAGNALRSLRGKNPDTVVLPVAVTCNKDNVTIEELGLASVTLTLAGLRDTLHNVLITGTGKVVIQTLGIGAQITVDSLRIFASTTANPLDIKTSGAINNLSAHFDLAVGGSGTNVLLVSAPVSLLAIKGGTIIDLGGTFTDYLVKSTFNVIQSVISLDTIACGSKGGIDIVGSENLIADMWIANTAAALDAGRRLLRVRSGGGVSVNTTVRNVRLLGQAGTDVLFECASADADADGLKLDAVTGRTGTVLGSQDAQWLGCDFAGCTINFQLKTGMYVEGGDMTGATLQNIPADIVFRGVKGQLDRGETVAKAKIKNNAVQSIAHNLITQITLQSTVYDNDTMKSGNTLVAKRPGKFQFRTRGAFASSALGTQRNIYIRHVQSGVIHALDVRTPIVGAITAMEASCDIDMVLNDSVEVLCFQDSGVGLDLASAAGYTAWLEGRFVG